MTEPSALRRTFAPLAQFPKPFWVINGLEFLERGAFYGLAAILSVYLVTQGGLSDAQVGFVFTVLFALLYFFPLVAAALADKFGYKAALMVTWAVLLVGYGLIPFAAGMTQVLLAVVFIGVGAGGFKPIAAALIAQSTTPEQRNFAYVIYYGGINLGAFLFPLSVGLVGVWAPHLLNPAAFAMATALIVVNLVLTVILFRNLRPPQRDVSVVRALSRLADIFKEPAFLVLLVIYSGFWFMYAMNQTFLPRYMVQFNVMPLWFNVALLATINPLTIIALAPFMGRFTERLPSLPLMMVGMSLYVVGFVLVGFAVTPAVFIAGIVVFSTGELLTQPSFLSYVSKIAPPDRVAVYLGYGFVPIGIGLVAGSAVGGVLYGRIATELGRPTLFWAIMSAMGLVTIAALVTYNVVLTRVRAAREAPEPAPAATRASRGLAWITGPGAAVVALLLIPALILGGAVAGPLAREAASGDGVGPSGTDARVVELALATVEGESQEGAPGSATFALAPNATRDVTFTLRWTDEPAGAGATNAPDTLRLHVTLPNGTMLMSEEAANPQGGEGVLVLMVPAVAGDYTVEVEAVDCGDVVIALGPLGLPAGGSEDTGNAWTLDVTHGATAA